MNKALETVRCVQAEAESMPEGEPKKNILARHWKSSESVGKIKAMITAATSIQELTVELGAMDRDNWYLNCKNGTLDLYDEVFDPHHREDLITKLTPFDYNPDATCPNWLKFLRNITDNDRDLIQFLQRAIGYSLTGETGEKCLFFLFGPTDSGKTTFIETMREMMGEYASGTDFNSFLYGKYGGAVRNDIARLEGKRFVSASEAGKGQKFDEPLVKQITGKDKVVARFLYREFEEFTPQFKVFLAANHMPTITGMDDAIWNRIMVLPFSVTIPKRDQDKNLHNKLRKEMPGILAWAVKGCYRWKEEGLKPTIRIKEALNSYREEYDIAQRFIKERCERREGAFTPFRHLFEAWEGWCKENHIVVETEKSFAQILEAKGFTGGTKRINRTQVRIREGIVLLDEID